MASFLAECLSNLIAQAVSWRLLSSRAMLVHVSLDYDVKFPNDGRPGRSSAVQQEGRCIG